MIFQQAWQENIVYLTEIDLIHIQLFKSTPNRSISQYKKRLLFICDIVIDHTIVGVACIVKGLRLNQTD